MKRYVTKSALEMKIPVDVVRGTSKNNKNSALSDRSNIMCKHERKQQSEMIPMTCSGNEGSTNTVIETNNDINYDRKPYTDEKDNRKGKSFYPESGLSKYNHIIDLKLKRNTSGRLDLSVSSSTTPQNDLGSQKDVTKTNCRKSLDSRRSFIPRTENRNPLTSWSKQRNSISPKSVDIKSQNRRHSSCTTNSTGSVKQRDEDISPKSTHSDKCLSKEKVKNSASNLDGKNVTRNQNYKHIYGTKVETPAREFDKTRKGKNLRHSVTPINTSSISNRSPSLIEHDNSQIHLDVKTVGKSKQTIVSNLDLINVNQPRRNGKLSCKMQTDAPCISRPITSKTDQKTNSGGSGRISSSNNSSYLLSRKSALPLIRPNPKLEKLLNKPNHQRNNLSPKKYNNFLETRARKLSISRETSLVSKKKTSREQGNDNTRRQFNNLNRVSDVYKQSKVIKFTSFGSLPSQQVVNYQDKYDKNYGQKSEKFENECKQNTQEVRRAVIKTSQVRLLPVRCAKPHDPKNIGTDCKSRDKVVTQSYLRPFDTQTDCKLDVKDTNSKTKRYVNDLNVKTCKCVITGDKILNQSAGIKSDSCVNLNEQSLKICHKPNGIVLPSVRGPVFSNGLLQQNNKAVSVTNVHCDSHNCSLVDDSNNSVTENHQDIITVVLGNTNNSSNTNQRPGRLKDLSYNKVACLYGHLSLNQINDLTCTLNIKNTEDLIYGSEDQRNLTRRFDNRLYCDIHASHSNTSYSRAYLKDENCYNSNSVECLKDKKACYIVCNNIDSDIKINRCIDDSESASLSNGFNTTFKKAETNLIEFDLKKDTYTGNRNETSYTMHKRLPQKRELNDTTTTRNANISRDLSRRSGTSISRNVKVDRPLRNDRETTNQHVDKEGQDKTVKVNRNRISSAKSSDSKKDGKLDNAKSSVRQNYSLCNTNDKTVNRQRCKTVTCKNKKTNLDAVTHVRQALHITTIDRVISEKSKRELSDIDISNIESSQAKSSCCCTLTQISCVNNENSDHTRENEVKLQPTDIGNYAENGGNVENNCESAKEISSAYHETKSNNAITFADEFKSGNVGLDQCEVQGAEDTLLGRSVLSNTEKESVNVINRKYLDSRCSTIKDGALLTDSTSELSAVQIEVNLDASYRESNVGLSKVGVSNICDGHSEKPINNKTETSCISLQSTDSNQSLQNGCENRFSSSLLGNFTCVRKSYFNKEDRNLPSGEQNCKSLDNSTLRDGNNYDVFINDCNAGNEPVITSDKKDNWLSAMDLQLPSAPIGDDNSETKLHNDAKLNSHNQTQNILDENCDKNNFAQENLSSKISSNIHNIEESHVLQQSKLCNKNCVIGADSDVTGARTIFIQDETVLNIENQDESVIETENKPEEEVTKTNKSESKPGEGYTSSTACSDKTTRNKGLSRNKSASSSVDNRLKTSLSKSSMNKKISQPGECKQTINKSGQTGGSNIQRSRSVTPVSKRSSLSSTDNISNKTEIKSKVISKNGKSDLESKHLNNDNQTGTKSKEISKMSSAIKTTKNQTQKSRIPSASNVKDVSTFKNVGTSAQTKQDALRRNSQVQEVPKIQSEKSKKQQVKGTVSSNRRLSASSSKESSPVVLKTQTPERTSDQLKDTKNDLKKSNPSIREKTPPKQASATSMRKTKTSKVEVKSPSPPRSDSTSIRNRKDIQTKDKKTIQNREKLLQRDMKSESKSPQQSPDLNKARQICSEEIQSNKTQQRLGNSKCASESKPKIKSAIPTPKGIAMNAKKNDKATKSEISPTAGSKSNLQDGNKILTLTRQNVQRLSQINSGKITKTPMSNQSSPALSRKSISKIGGTGTKSFEKRSTVSSRGRAAVLSKESSPALSRRSSTSCDTDLSHLAKRLSAGAVRTRNTKENNIATRKSGLLSMQTAEAAKKKTTNKYTPDTKKTKESCPASAKETRVNLPSTGELQKSRPGAVTVAKQTKLSVNIDHNTRSSRESRQVSASNVNIVNRHSTAKHVINNKTAQKGDSYRQRKENILLPRTSTPTVNKIKFSAQDSKQDIKTSDNIEITASNSPEIEEVLLSDDPLIASSPVIETTSEIKTEDDMHIDNRFRFKAEPEERLPSLMQIYRCEMSDTDSDIGDEKSNLGKNIPISESSSPLFETDIKDAEKVPGAPVNDCDINKHLNLHMVDIMDNKSTKFESVSVSEDEDADCINKSCDNNSVSDLEEYWSLSEDENDGTFTESQMNHELFDNTSDKKDEVCLDLKNYSNNYTTIGLSDTSINEVAIPEEVYNQVENMKIESRHVQQLHRGESGTHFVQVADDVKTICEIEEITNDTCIPTQMEYFISQNTYLDQDSDKNKYTFDLQDENITHSAKCDPFSERPLINSSERCKNSVGDKNRYGVEDCEEKLPLNTKLDEYIDETNDKIKNRMYVDSKGVSIPKHMNGFNDEQVEDGDLEIYSDRMSHLSLRNIIPHQNRPDYLSSKSKTLTEETQRCSGLLTVKRESSESGEDERRDKDGFVKECAVVDIIGEEYNVCENKNDGDSICQSSGLNEIGIKDETQVVKNNEYIEDFDSDEKQLPASDIKNKAESYLDASEIENTKNIKCLNINKNIPDKILEVREHIHFQNKTEPPFSNTESISETEELLNAADLNILNSQSQNERLRDTDNDVCNMNYDKDGDLDRIGIFELQGEDLDSDNISEEICDISEEGDIEMDQKMEYLATTKMVTFSVKTGFETDSVSGKRVVRKRRVAKYETVVLPGKTEAHEGEQSDKSENINSLKDSDENSQSFRENKGISVQSKSDEDEGGFVYKEMVNTSCLNKESLKSEHKETAGEHIDAINEEPNLVNLLAEQQVSDNDYRTVDNELSIDSSNNVNGNAKHTESLQLCNEGNISETALSNHRRRSVLHSTNSSTNNNSDITPDFKADEPINIEIRANNAMQSQSEIHGFNSGLGYLSENEFGVKTGINVIGPSPGSEVIIDSGYDFNTSFKGDQRLLSSDNKLENQRDHTICNLDSRTINDRDFSKPCLADITSFSDISDNNDILQTNINDTDSVFLNSGDCLSATQITKMAILKTRSSEDDYTGYEQSQKIKINDTFLEEKDDLFVKTQSLSFNNENKDASTETADDTIMKNNTKSITNQTPSEDQRKSNNAEYSELTLTHLKTGDDNEIIGTDEEKRLRNLDIHTNQISITDTAAKKSIEKASDNAEMNNSPENDKEMPVLSKNSISRQNETFENVRDLSLSLRDQKEEFANSIASENALTLSSVETNLQNVLENNISQNKNQECYGHVEINSRENSETLQNSEQQTDEQIGTKPKSINRRDTGRNSFRRHTTNVCLADTLGSEDIFKVPEKPRARSKSPIGRNQKKCHEAKRPPPSCGMGRVSEICKAFIKKASKGTGVTSPERPLSPEPQTTSPTKKLKWVKDCGSWKRVPVDEFGNLTSSFRDLKTSTVSSELAPTSTGSTNEVSNADTKVNVRDIASKWQMYKRSNKANNEYEQTTAKSITKQEYDSSGLKTDSNTPMCLQNAAANENSKSNRGRVPPKTLPKPVKKPAKHVLEPIGIASNITVKITDPTAATCQQQDTEERVKNKDNFTHSQDSASLIEQESSDYKELPKLSNDGLISGTTKDQTETDDRNKELESVKTTYSGILSSDNERVVESNEVVDALSPKNKSYLETDNKLLSGPEDMRDKSSLIAPKLDEHTKIESGDVKAGKTESSELKQPPGVKTPGIESQISDMETKSHENQTTEQLSERERNSKTISVNDSQNSKIGRNSGNKYMKPDNKFGLTKSLMAAKPYVKSETDINPMPNMDSELHQGGLFESAETSISTTIGSPKLKAVRIKQEVFPKEDTDDDNLTDNLTSRESDKTRRDAAQWISPIKEALYQLKKQENIKRENYNPNVKFKISDNDESVSESHESSRLFEKPDPRGQGSETQSLDDFYERSNSSGQGSSLLNRPLLDQGHEFSKQYSNSGTYVYSGYLGHSVDQKPLLANVDYKHDGGEAMYYPRSPGTVQKQLLSEILELEENINEDNTHTSTYEPEEQDNDEGEESEPCSTPTKPEINDVKTNHQEYRRSNSLPSGSLSNEMGHTIYYKDGQFVIEPNRKKFKDLDFEIPTPDKNSHKKKFNFDNYHKIKSSKSCQNEGENEINYYENEADVFVENDGNITVIESDESLTSPVSDHGGVHKRLIKCDSEGQISRPLSVDENQLESFMSDSKCAKNKIIGNSKLKNRRSASFKDIRPKKIKVKRNSSFKEAQEKGSIQDSEIDDDEMTTPDFIPKEELRPKSPGFLQKLLSRRRLSEKGVNSKNSDQNKDISGSSRKTSLRNLFLGKKGKGRNASVPNFSSEPGTPGTPPIAAFQNDLDIHIVESAPNSPYSNRQFRRRHTSADIYEQNNQGMYQSVTDVSNYRTHRLKSDDQISVQSLVINQMEQPLRPKSPKPTGVTITRRNSNLSLHNSPHKDVHFEIGSRSDMDTISMCSVVSSNIDNVTSVTFDSTSSRRPSKNPPVLQHDKGFNDLVQGEMSYSNSNDSGIQHDVSAHSSNESLKTSQDSTSSVIRRHKSPSPRPERPKSEISVRWADLVETTEITPVKRREGSQNLKNKPRPISDLEDNIEFFDEMYGDVIDDFQSFTGGSSLSPDMKSSFGSQISLQPYSSLQNLEKLKRQDSFDSKPCKRRMSTPHPIKSRQKQAIPKQKKQHHTSPLVRSHSMPESLDKLHNQKKLYITLGSSNLHGEGLLHHGEDDSSSDDGSDISIDRMSLYEKSLSARSSNIQLATLDEISEVENLIFAEALWDHITMDPEELGFRAGDVIEVMDNSNKDWWWGAVDDKDGAREGWFPATFVRLRVNQEQIEEELATRLQEVAPEHRSPKLRRISMINQDQARENVVNEIIHAEREYVKHLKDVVEGYVRHARKRTDMFSEERISVMFGNIEEIYDFSNRFLESLESAFQENHPHLSELGQCFLDHSKEFEIYSDYCNNHPSASEELKDSYRKQKYRHFFEACRLLQEMIEIPLEGFLLTPVQKICKYPLQLAELLKYTSTNHPDYANVQAALESMKKIAALINERKRKMESIEKLSAWQQTVEDWQGSDLLERSSELILAAEANKINTAGWSQERFFFLFDHQLVYCKKDLLKKNGYSYKGRIDMDDCEIIPLEDGKDSQYNVTVKNAWKIHEKARDKWYLLFAKTAAEKQRWLKAYNTERQRVREDQENNFVPVYWKRNILNKLRANKGKSNSSRNTAPVDYTREFIRGMPSHATLPRSFGKKQQEKKKGWFVFGKHKSK